MVRPPAGEEASTTECTGARNRRAERRRKGVAASEEKSKHPRGEGNNSPLSSSTQYSVQSSNKIHSAKNKKEELGRRSRNNTREENLSLDF